MAISDEITRLQQAKAALKTSIEGKGVTVSSDATLDDYPALVDSIEAGGGGGSVSEEPTVKFIDYDGSIVESYTPSEFASLSYMPENPDHTSDGLVSQGWNWTLANAKTYVETYGALNIGQMYTTDNGATRITIDTTDWEKQWEITLQFNQSKANGVAVDFGDGSTVERVSGTSNVKFYHTYANAGVFTISLLPDVGCTITISGGSYGCYIVGGSSSDARFMRSSVFSVFIGERLSLGSYAFNNCYSLQSVTIPSSVTSIGTYAFNNCYSLQSATIPSGVTSIGTYTFNNCYSLQSATIPSGVKSIGNYAFNNCYSLQSATIPSGVKSIGNYAFNNCYFLQYATIPSGVTSIGSSTFNNCYPLKSATIPSGVTSITDSLFSNCHSLQSVTIPSSVKSIGNSVFYYCYSLQSVTIPSGVTSIGNNAFYNCYSLQSVTIPSGVTSIGTYAFNNCSSLKSVTIPSGVTSIGTYAFNNCSSLKSVTIPSGVTSITDSLFSNCHSLQSVTIPSSVKSIGNSVFYYCYSLQSVTIPSGVTSIGNNAFYYCDSLIEIIFEGTTPPTLGGSSNSLGQSSNKAIIYVPDESVDTYKSRYTTYASRIKGISERE